ncbi:MAG: hypothetical protein FJ308_20850 [Planctomycetes bacterium]|nr:hypothetical protein [Planctomycetota bacterium]
MMQPFQDASLAHSVTIIDSAGQNRSLEVWVGDIAAQTQPNPIDLLVLSAFPDDYAKVEGTVIHRLSQTGIDVANLASDKSSQTIGQDGNHGSVSPPNSPWYSNWFASSQKSTSDRRIALEIFSEPSASNSSLAGITQIEQSVPCACRYSPPAAEIPQEKKCSRQSYPRHGSTLVRDCQYSDCNSFSDCAIPESIPFSSRLESN